MPKHIILLLFSFVLSACGGGGTIGTFSTNKIFSDGAGVGRLTIKGTNEQGYVIAPEIVALSEQMETLTGNDLVEIDPNDFPVVGTLANGANVHQGAVVTDGVGVNITVIVEPGEKSYVAYYEIPNLATMVLASGPSYKTAPSGNYTYTGNWGMAARNSGSVGEMGSFELIADFNNNSFSYVGATDNSGLTGSGYINTGNGQLSSASMTFSNDGDIRTATLNGLLHGNSAEGVSGVFHTNESNPNYAGAFSGTR